MHVSRRRSRVAVLPSSSLALGAAALLVGACASAGGPFPSVGNSAASIANAERLIAEAQQAGADSLAPDLMSAARQEFADAQVLARRGESDRAAVRGREAVADATYARAVAQRVTAERERDRAKAALDAIPGGPQ